tara:strand:+ start:1271 stop:1519 length:249 start_codon:yes stop_codon:yes gene_type:complete
MLKLAMSDTYSDFEEKMKNVKSKHARYQLKLRREILALKKSIRAQEDAIEDIGDENVQGRMTSVVAQMQDRVKAMRMEISGN